MTVLDNSRCLANGFGSQVTCRADAANNMVTLGQVYDSVKPDGTKIEFEVDSI